MNHPVPVYVFRAGYFGRGADTVISAAPMEAVAKVYGGGGLKQADGLSAVFGGSATYSDEATGAWYLGVWGARKASKFRGDLRRAGLNITIVRTVPPGRLKWYSTR